MTDLIVDVVIPEIAVEVVTPEFEVVISGAPGPPGGLSGPAGGDLTGTYPNPTLAVDRVRIGGDTMSGPLVLSADPQQPLAAATKQYVDGRTPHITTSTTAPSSPTVGDVWIDIN